jgi:hypothetical protein
VDVIAAAPSLRNRAAQTLMLFVTVLTVAIVLAIPDQTAGPLGGELVALGVIAGVTLFVLDQRARRGDRNPETETLARVLDEAAPNTLSAVLITAAGVMAILGLPAGLDVLVVPVVLGLFSGVASAWLLLTTPGTGPVPAEPAPAPAASAQPASAGSASGSGSELTSG